MSALLEGTIPMEVELQPAQENNAGEAPGLSS